MLRKLLLLLDNYFELVYKFMFLIYYKVLEVIVFKKRK